jgi:PAS domain S-box-containing protein
MRQLTRTLQKLAAQARPEDAVRARAEALLAYLADVPMAILIANNRAHYVETNQHAVRLTGFSRAELGRMTLADLTPNPNGALGRRLWRAFLERGQMAGRYELRRKNGSIVTVQYLAIANVLPGIHVSALAPVKKNRRPRARRTSRQ